MAASDPVLVNLPSATFLLSAESGVIIQSSSRNVESKLKEIFNAAVGSVVGYVFYDFVAQMDWSAILNGTTGLGAAQPGVALTMGNNLGVGTAGNGVANSGGIYCKTAKVSHQGEDLRMVSGTAMQRATVT